MLPGNDVVKVLARDVTTDRIGTFLHPIVVPNLEKESNTTAYWRGRSRSPGKHPSGDAWEHPRHSVSAPLKYAENCPFV